MSRKSVLLKGACILGIALTATAQQSDIIIKLTQGERAAIAVPDFRGTGETQQYMDAFNETLFSDLQTSGLFRMVPKTSYPLQVPQRPEDFRPPLVPDRSGRQRTPQSATRQGPWLTDWSDPPANANFLTLGYAAERDNQIVLSAWLYNVTQTDLANAHVFGKIYFGTIDEEGARKVAHEFATDILSRFGAQSLVGSKIYFVSDRTGTKEVWSMDYDGSNQKRFTSYNSTSIMPAVSPDATKIAFTSYLKGNPAILIHSLETGRRLPFYNQVASMNATACFTPDSQQIVFSSTATGYAQLYMANVDGSNLRRLTHSRAIDIEPKVNPKTGTDLVFVSGRSGIPQVYRMNMDGADVQRLSAGEGDAVNPAWHPDGQHIAFSWTRGYAPGNYNIFVMDVATRNVVQLTYGAGRNENPNWAPDGRHIVFSSNRSGTTQIYVMLADGTQVKQLTTQGQNMTPVWNR